MVDLDNKFVYVARKQPCGCVLGLVTDDADKDTGRAVGEFIGWGMTVDRVSWRVYREEISNEPTFMDCPHREPKAEQPALFEIA